MTEEVKENEEYLKETIKDTQMLIRNSMLHHKKAAKRLHGEIKKEKKTLELYKEKISKLTAEKDKLESKLSIQTLNSKSGKADSFPALREQIKREVEERTELEEKVKEIKEDFLMIKLDMGGLNATQQVQERYEKHIRILENRLDKANQKFNSSIEYDKKLRDEIDQLRKERFFFENIYKKLEKELEKLRKEISINLEAAYESYEKRDRNQENFENIKAQMIKKESEYAQILSSIANDINIRNSSKKTGELGMKDSASKMYKLEKDSDGYGKHSGKNNGDENPNENLQEKLQNLQYKFQKLEEFTDQSNVESFCKQFKKNAQKNFDLFQAISMVSKQAKQTEKEIKDLEEEVATIKKSKVGKVGIEKNIMLNELKSKTQKLIQRHDKYENETKKNTDEFKQIKNHIYNIYMSLDESKYNSNNNEKDKDDSCGIVSNTNKILMENGLTESNVMLYISEVEVRLKNLLRFFENDRMANNDDQEMATKSRIIEKVGKNPKQVADEMRATFASMEISKIKTFDNIKKEHRNEEIKFESIKEFSEKIAKELMDQLKSDNKEKASKSRINKKFR